MNNYFEFFLSYPLSGLSVFITLVPIFIILQRKAYLDPAIRYLFIYLVIKLIIDLIMLQFVINNLNNLLFYNINIVIRYVLLSGMLYNYFDSSFIKRLILVVAIGFVGFSVWDILSVNSNLKDTSNHELVRYSSTVESVLMIFWMLAFYYEAIQSLRIENLLAFPFFWICSGLLLYFSTYVFIAPLLHYVAKWEDRFELGLLYSAPYLFEVISMVLIGFGTTHYSHRQYDRS